MTEKETECYKCAPEKETDEAVKRCGKATKRLTPL